MATNKKRATDDEIIAAYEEYCANPDRWVNTGKMVEELGIGRQTLYNVLARNGVKPRHRRETAAMEDTGNLAVFQAAWRAIRLAHAILDGSVTPEWARVELSEMAADMEQLARRIIGDEDTGK